MRRWALVTVLLLAGAIYSTGVAGSAKERRARPNRRQPDLVLILVDAMRSDHLSLYGYRRRTTSHLERRPAEMRWFTDAVAQSTQTASSVASLFTGVPPMEHGIQYDTIGTYFPSYGEFPLLDTALPTLAETLNAAGYETRALVGNPWISARTRFDRGFDRFDGWKVWDMKGGANQDKLAPLTNDAALMDALGGWVEERPRTRPRFAYAHLMTVHNPYDKGRYRFVRAKGNSRYVNGLASPSSRDLRFLIDLYDSNVAYTDTLIGALLDRLARRRSARPVVVCVVSDHGDEFLEHGGLGHGTTVYNELAHVPVIFWGPGVITRTGPSRYPLALTDVRDILLSLALVQGGTRGLVSSAVPPLSAPEGRRRVVELNNDKAIIELPWKYVVTKSPLTEGLFKLEDDPRERRNVASVEKERLRHFRRIAERLWADIPYPAGDTAAAKSHTAASLKHAPGLYKEGE